MLQPGIDQQPIEIDRLRDGFHPVIRADDEENVLAGRIERRHGLGDAANILVGARDGAAMSRRAERGVVARIVRLREPQQSHDRGALAEHFLAKALGRDVVALGALRDREPLLGTQRAAAGTEAAGRVVDPAKPVGVEKIGRAR